RFKENTINDALSRIGGLDLKVEKFHHAKNITGYRNKAVYPVGVDKDGKAISGFYASNSHRIICHDSCMISNPDFVKIRDSVIAFINENHLSVYNETTGKGLIRNIFLRSANSGETGLTLIINDNPNSTRVWQTAFVKDMTEKFPFIKTIVLNFNTKSTNVILGEKSLCLFGDGYIYDELCGKNFRINFKSFWQVNRQQAEVLYTIAKEFASLGKDDVLVDLYCGTGSVGISIADKSTRLYGVEVIEDAAKDADFNAHLNGIDGKFVALAAENALDDPFITSLKPDVITVDPPRKGCVGAVEKTAALGAKRIVYISCDPATLARDLAEFDKLGYKAQRVQAVDMFPRTGHVESVALLVRTDSSI
ncbi:MAG: 23S rRNA (uracil(1939)-C(5))-methyltransferase RlmD, partial [Clostridia bacterium]|nr:23S rRNA (uracil(1939)-C(5))-methyltransferase RlmD [Clostridia bacterium]